MNSKELGLAGENLVKMYFTSLGSDVSLSEDKYDDRKDMMIDGVDAEVKTQTLYRNFGPLSKQAFTVSITTDGTKIYSNQLNKCMNSTRLIFVQRSSFADACVRIYEAPSLGARNFTIAQNKNDKRYVAGFLTETMTLLKTYTSKGIVDFFKEEERTYA